MQKTLLLRDASQVRVLAHPLRMRIIEALRTQEGSPRQVADVLGTKPTRLYHHFAALEQAGLITLEGTRQRRGVVERLYRPAARQFVVDRALFEGPQRRRRGASVVSAASAMFAVTLEELRSGVEAGTMPLTDRQRAELGSFRLELAPGKLPLLMRRLRELVAEAQAAEVGEGGEPVRLTVALFPVGTKAPVASRGSRGKRGGKSSKGIRRGALEPPAGPART
ncbi:MAG: helix-turn-helix domain-containing protein [Myxococcaceae bacterium]|nr:helix-turn-helix domain-containing protein [Myxococcaceae bacterium]